MHEGLDLVTGCFESTDYVNKFKPGNCATRLLHTCMIDELAFNLKFPKLTSRLSSKAPTKARSMQSDDADHKITQKFSRRRFFPLSQSNISARTPHMLNEDKIIFNQLHFFCFFPFVIFPSKRHCD